MNESQIVEIIAEAELEANKAAGKFFDEKLGGQDNYPCGFAWVYITNFDGKKITGNTKVGKWLKNAGVRQDYNRMFQIWNPAAFGCQNVDTLYAGAQAAADVFKKYGFTAYADSRLD